MFYRECFKTSFICCFIVFYCVKFNLTDFFFLFCLWWLIFVGIILICSTGKVFIKSYKNYFKEKCILYSQYAFCTHKPDGFELHNHLKLICVRFNEFHYLLSFFFFFSCQTIPSSICFGLVRNESSLGCWNKIFF